MLNNLYKETLLERLQNFKRVKETTLENIESSKKCLKEEDKPVNYKILQNYNKLLKEIENNITILEQLYNVHFDWFKQQKIVIATSNESKLNEIKRIIPSIESLPFSKDIEEVDGTIDEVILHKAKDAKHQNFIKSGTSIIVEDTIIRNLDTNQDITDIKWTVDSLKEGTNVEWITSLALNDGINIYIFRGNQRGVVTRERGDEGFAFDPYFIPEELYQDYNKNYTRNGFNYGKAYPNYTLGELDKIGLKDMFSARSKALNCLNEFRLDKVVQLIDVKDWEGRYQNEKEFKVNFVDLEDSKFFDSYLIENQKKFKCFNDFKNFLYELDIDFSFSEVKDFVKENQEVYISIDPYDLSMYGTKTLIIKNNIEDLYYNIEQSFNDI